MKYVGQGLIEHPVRVGEIFVSTDDKHIISAIGLGSCVGVIAYDPEVSVGGIAHIQLPNSTEMGCSRSRKPFANADKGIQELLRQLKRSGASLDRLYVALIGGAQIGEGADMFSVGLKNQKACIQILRTHRLKINERRLGGNTWRSVKLILLTGQISIRRKDGEFEFINIPGSRNEEHQFREETQILKSAKDIEIALAHITDKSETSEAGKESRSISQRDIERALAHLPQPKFSNAKQQERKRTKINNLEELKTALSHLTDSCSKNDSSKPENKKRPRK